MEFRNKQNGHTVQKSAPALWAFLFGFFYFLASGIFVHAALMFFLSVVLLASFGPAGMMLVFVMNIIYCVLAGGIVRNHYLSKGWEEVGGENSQAPAVEKYRACPFCGEEILSVAIKCKHCQSTVEPITEAVDDRNIPEGVKFAEKPAKMSLGEYQEVIMARNKITQCATGYVMYGQTYPTFEDVLNELRKV